MQQFPPQLFSNTRRGQEVARRAIDPAIRNTVEVTVKGDGEPQPGDPEDPVLQLQASRGAVHEGPTVSAAGAHTSPTVGLQVAMVNPARPRRHTSRQATGNPHGALAK